MTRLPIDDALPDLIAALRTGGRAVLQAPPGAGKTTKVPLAMLEAGLCNGRIIMLEPRRLAARAAAERMAETLGERPGETVGYRIRGEAKVSKSTRIEVVTEGILTRMLQSAPDLPGVGAVIFDEFHERSLNADLGLALCLEVAGALRDDLILLAMSATLDAAPVSALMEAPLITSEGRSFPVETRWLDTPLGPKARRTDALVDLVTRAEAETRKEGGGILVFLPGEGEIRRAAAALESRLPGNCTVHPLFGALPFAQQRAAIQPAKSGRKVVLATSIAETSLTIDGVRVVVDMGQSRRARFDPGSGMSRLVTEKVTRAEATQRQGRAGRVSEGICYRLWTKGEEGALAAFPPAEIASADLAGLALELALWGAGAGDLAFLTPPPEGALQEARNLLTLLGALDAQGRITTHGKALSALPLHPRLGHMLLRAGPDQAAPAATLAALLAERDPLRGAPSDLMLRLEALKDPKAFQRKRPYQLALPVVERIRAEARRLQQQQRKTRSDASVVSNLSAAGLAALAYPDRIGQRRKGDTPRYVLSGGKGAVLSPEDTLAAAPFLVALDTDGNPREAKIRMAVQIALADIRALFADQIRWQDSCAWSKRDRRVVARSQERLGSVVLDDRIWKDVPTEAIAEAMLDGVRDLGLRLSGAAARLLARVELLRADGQDLPDFSDDGLMATLDDWLLPMLTGVKTAQDWKQFDPLPALRAALSWEQTQLLDREAPGHFVTPLGRKIPIDYGEEVPEIAVRLQEMFGVTRHPAVGGVPLKVTLLSPAQRPIQITRDLPGFWAGSYADVRKDMRAQYPKHPWPEDPTGADPTLRANRRKS
ncbi:MULTISPECIES: ATP-dependent helicase HrpB [Rhodobacterales]|jgi:ATP-dependent helicase HrpB|uniref:ATP-dependent helicase HrpB n=1 Tax=Rhodobacterales TaxID=204455 RepID=UPI00237F5BC3|nr:ATP-dependent helicase HrpB [Phaeobacter gallaeciensis]MDE4140909.1 ATP-dependent helicase HrpB [Phaeobacter gallaeciensis]MDE4149354.1 ATP-dependent helicase HrpB [Phaeobacter gallaeciensis]MDE4153453.1 ATP-dependent helicase HrpB [Phaeobacter gallaeciensis]MDE4228842.1 ATP-dependent helicase HrpB [Phaeobacter gallaeciensis]MDE4257917.1 ATP-dependent helicase HrpB [Phaeobacter gallaeciensis]